MKYLLDKDHNPYPVEDPIEWAKGFEPERKRVAENTVGQFWISTVFLGLDHNYGEDGPPLLFETMAFPIREDDRLIEDYCERYATWDEAVAGHNRAVTLYQSKLQ